MNSMLWVIIAIAVIAVLAVILIGARSRRSRLRPLPDDARMRYAEEWRQLEMRFVDAPQQAVSEADGLVLNIYRQRGGSDRELPRHVREARERVHGHEGEESMTENLRHAMQHYRSAVEDLIGTDPREAATGRREIAS